VADPVGDGFVESLSHPGGNITGFSVMQPTITGKYLSILRQLNLELTRVGILYNAASTPDGGTTSVRMFSEAAKNFHVKPVSIEVHSPDDIEAAMAEFASVQGGALVVLAGNFTTLYRKTIISLASRLRIPTLYPYRYFVDDGGLMSYGVDIVDLFTRAPDYVDRILKGAKPRDLPVQGPKKFELVINLKEAHALGLILSRTLLAGADELIN
jgi:putative ABC transport system substrate-binding protein